MNRSTDSFAQYPPCSLLCFPFHSNRISSSFPSAFQIRICLCVCVGVSVCGCSFVASLDRYINVRTVLVQLMFFYISCFHIFFVLVIRLRCAKIRCTRTKNISLSVISIVQKFITAPFFTSQCLQFGNVASTKSNNIHERKKQTTAPSSLTRPALVTIWCLLFQLLIMLLLVKRYLKIV